VCKGGDVFRTEEYRGTRGFFHANNTQEEENTLAGEKGKLEPDGMKKTSDHGLCERRWGFWERGGKRGRGGGAREGDAGRDTEAGTSRWKGCVEVDVRGEGGEGMNG